MRVLFFSKTCSVHDRRFLRKLAESGHEICFLPLEVPVRSSAGIPATVRVLESLGAEPGGNPEMWSREAPAFRSVVASLQPDIIHAGPIQSCGYVAALAGIRPLLLMSWGFDLLIDADRGGTWREATRTALGHADMLFVDCETVRIRAAQLGFSEDARVLQFPWGVDLGKFGSATSDMGFRQGRDIFVILSTRAWEPGYGIDVLLRAFRLAYKSESRLRLVLAGEGSLAAEVEGYVRQHGLREAVYCPGAIGEDALPSFFASADAYVSCSPSDGSSISLLEAMATGLPVIVADEAGNREWVTPGNNGWLAEASDERAFAGAMICASQLDAPGRRLIATRNRAACQDRADWDRNFPKLLTAYERLISLSGRTPSK